MKKFFILMLLGGVITHWDNINNYLNMPKGYSEDAPVAYSDSDWYTDYYGYEEAMRVSGENGSPVFIYVYTDWCKYCARFSKQLLTQNSVEEALSHFVKVKINPEHSAEDAELKKELGNRGYPALFVQLNPDSKPIRIRGPFFKRGNTWKMMNAGDFIKILNVS